MLATTAMVGDLAERVGGEDAKVEVLMGPGVDPHLHKPTPGDLARLRRAEVILYSGLGLEGKFGEVLERLERRARVLAVAETLPEERLLSAEGEAHPDPHAWFDVALWAEGADSVAGVLAQARPDRADAFRARAARAKEDLRRLDEEVRRRLQAVPGERRILVTSHDAFSYFGRAYGFEVVALQGISTATEAGLADVTKLVRFVRDRGVPALFIESSVSPATLERVSRDSGARIGGELFSDAAGSALEQIEGYPLSSYAGMILHNVQVILDGLGAAPAAE